MLPENPEKFQECVLWCAEDYFNSLLDGINKAQRTIDLEVYIFQSDLIGRRILQALTSAASRGIRVRVLVDGMGASQNIIKSAHALSQQGGQLKIYHPAPWTLYQWSLAVIHGRGLQKLLYLLNYVNRRNHRKTMMVDGRDIWLGSFNIARDHLPVSAGGEDWLDCGIKISHSPSQAPALGFERAWNGESSGTQRRATRQNDAGFLLNYSGRLRRQHRRLIQQRLGQSKQRIWITNAYFSPHRKILKALKVAARRGVDVRLILPQASDVVFMPWAASYFYGALVAAGVRIFEYQPSVLHAKTMIIDQQGMIGSSNLNGRSAFRDLEIDYIVQTPDSLKSLERGFEETLSNCNELTRKDLTRKKRWRRILGFLTLILLRRWL